MQQDIRTQLVKQMPDFDNNKYLKQRSEEEALKKESKSEINILLDTLEEQLKHANENMRVISTIKDKLQVYNKVSDDKDMRKTDNPYSEGILSRICNINQGLIEINTEVSQKLGEINSYL